MKRDYVLHPAPASAGRTLWNNLVRGYHTSTLSAEKDFEQVTPQETALATGVCVFKYQGEAQIRVSSNEPLSLEAEPEQVFRDAEGALKKVCEQKGIPLIDQA